MRTESWPRLPVAEPPDAQRVRAEVAEALKRLAGDVRAGEMERQFSVLGDRLGMRSGQVKRLWYQEWRVVPAWVADRVRGLELRARQQAAAGRAADMEIARRDQHVCQMLEAAAGAPAAALRPVAAARRPGLPGGRGGVDAQPAAPPVTE